MKHIIVTFSILLSCLFSQAQTADQIIQESIDAIGGTAAWSKVTGIQFLSTIEQGGMKIPLDIVFLADGRTYTEYTLQGMTMTQMAFDGKTLWGTNFMNQKPEKSDAEATENYKRTLGEFPNALFSYKKLGYTATLEGEEKIDGTDCYKIKIVKKNQLAEGVELPNIEYYFIDKESKALLQLESEIMSGAMKGKVSQIKYSDYQELDGLFIAYSQSMGIKDGMTQAISMSQIVINPIVVDDHFLYKGE